MSQRSGIAGLLVFGSLLAAVLAPAAASAEYTGTTAFTCVKGKGILRGEHCLTTGTAAAEYGHVEITQDTATEATIANEKTNEATSLSEPTILKATVSGINLEVEGKAVAGTGTITNKVDPETKEHYVHGTGTLTFKEAKVLAPTKCALEKPEYTSKALTVTTQEIAGAGTTPGMGVKIKPVEGEILIEFSVVNGSGECPAALKGTYQVTGSAIGDRTGATITFSESKVTEQNTLKVRGAVKAGLSGKLTARSRESAKGDSLYTPVSSTTEDEAKTQEEKEAEEKETKEEQEKTEEEEATVVKGTGTTAFTCIKGKGTLRGEHCLTEGSAAAEYGHYAFSQDTTTSVTGSNSKAASETTAAQPMTLKMTVSGINVELRANSVAASGSLTNKFDGASSQHYIHTRGIVTFKEMAMLAPAKCALEKSEYTTKEVTSTTQGVEGAGTEKGMGVKFVPAEGEVVIELSIVGAECPAAIKGVYALSGSVVADVNGATLLFTHTKTTEQNTLKVKGAVKAGLNGVLTASGKDEAKGDSVYTPLSATTVK